MTEQSWWGHKNDNAGSKLAEATLNEYHKVERSIAGRKKGIAAGLLVSCALFVLFALPLAAQELDVAGTVRDARGSVIPAASVKLTNEATGTALSTSTDRSGLYSFPHVVAGVYDLSVSRAGFQTQIKAGIKLSVAQNALINFDMKVGTTSETVTVTSEQQMLQTADAATGQVVDRQFMNDLPLVGRSAMDLAFLAPGVQQAPTTAYGTNPAAGAVPYMAGTNFISDGSRNATSDVLIDGNTTFQEVTSGGSSESVYTPSVDAIQEFNVQQTNFSAEYGFSGATITNLITRSGTNRFHGVLYEFIRNNKLDSNNYFANQAGVALPGLHDNIFGGTVGGPIFKNRTFFFFDYEGTRSTNLSTSTAGVPSAAEKTGNFGELCGGDGPNGPAPGATFDANGECSNVNGQLWDPYTGVYTPTASPAGAVRSAFIPYNNLAAYSSPGNPILPSGLQVPSGAGNLIDPSAQKLMAYYPAPNMNVGASNYSPYNNYISSSPTTLNNDQWDLKIDHHFSERDMLSARYSHRLTFLHTGNCYSNTNGTEDEADVCTQGPENSTAHLFTVDYNHVFSAKTLLSFSYGITRTARFLQTIAGDFPAGTLDPVTSLGMPSYIDTPSQPKVFPTIGMGDTYLNAGSSGYSIGTDPWSYLKDGQDTHDLLVTLSHLQGRHELKFGFEGRFHQFNNGQPATPAGLYVYDQTGTDEDSGWSGGGDAMASFLTGVGMGGWGQYNIPAFLATENFAYAGFAQDNFHASSKLTVNVGLRYDLTMPSIERHNEMNWLDLTTTDPVQAGGGLTSLVGGDQFTSSSRRSDYNANYKNFGPRVGLAYSLNDKTVVRSGYGIYYDPSQVQADADVADVQGFSQNTTWQTSYPYAGDGAVPIGKLSNPFPLGILQPAGASRGLLNNFGFTAEGPVRTMNATPYEQSWSFEIQRSLPWNLLTDATYIGKKGTHLLLGVSGDFNLNHLPESTLGDSQAQIQQLVTYVSNPYASAIGSVAPTSTMAASTVPSYELQLPYPQFPSGVLVLNPPWANSSYNAFQLRVQKRMSNGLQFLVTYVFSKSIDDSSLAGDGGSFFGGSTSSVVDPNDPKKLARSVSEFNIPQVFQFTYTYALPFGRGQHFGASVNPIVNGFIGGWQTNGIWRFDDGQPITLGLSGGVAMPTFGQTPELTGVPKRNHGSNWRSQYFADNSVFNIPAPYTLGNTPRTLSTVNAPGTANASLSAFKEFSLDSLREGSHLEFRLESFNALNHPQFCAPNATVGSGSTFGTVTCQANLPRQVQGALKLYF